MESAKRPIGFFDSGVGGISVLRAAVQALPMEQFLYYGDSLHAPYGIKSTQEVIQLTMDAAELLLTQAGCKILVIACNTATAAAIRTLRERWPQIPIIGTEPAVKPAVERFPGGRVLMLATPMTVREEKFLRLKAKYDDQAEIVPVACGGLMEFVERGELEGPELDAFLQEKLSPCLEGGADALVLGCTHYPFLRNAIRRIVGPGPEIFDGSDGVAMQLKRKLTQLGLLNPGPEAGGVEFRNSLASEQILALSRRLLTSDTGAAEC